MIQRVIRCTLSGSFHRDREGLRNIYNELVTCGCQVISPHRLDFDSVTTLFVRDQAEHELSEVELEKHHLLGIKQSHFLWVHAPNGYIGTSTAFEIGYAVANHLPVFSSTQIDDVMLRHFVHVVPSVFSAIKDINIKFR